MLAKYLIAAGIEIADPNKAVSSLDLARASPAMAVAPRRATVGYPRSVAFVADGSRVDAVDALNGSAIASWDAGAPVSALAFDDRANRLLVGLASNGKVALYDLSLFMSVHGQRAPPTLTSSIESGLASVDQIVVPADGQEIAFRGSGGLTVVERTTGVVMARKPIVAQQIATRRSSRSGRASSSSTRSRDL
jgi:hypothetical protein